MEIYLPYNICKLFIPKTPISDDLTMLVKYTNIDSLTIIILIMLHQQYQLPKYQKDGLAHLHRTGGVFTVQIHVHALIHEN